MEQFVQSALGDFAEVVHPRLRVTRSRESAPVQSSQIDETAPPELDAGANAHNWHLGGPHHSDPTHHSDTSGTVVPRQSHAMRVGDPGIPQNGRLARSRARSSSHLASRFCETSCSSTRHELHFHKQKAGLRVLSDRCSGHNVGVRCHQDVERLQNRTLSSSQLSEPPDHLGELRSSSSETVAPKIVTVETPTAWKALVLSMSRPATSNILLSSSSTRRAPSIAAAIRRAKTPPRGRQRVTYTWHTLGSLSRQRPANARKSRPRPSERHRRHLKPRMSNS